VTGYAFTDFPDLAAARIRLWRHAITQSRVPAQPGGKRLRAASAVIGPAKTRRCEERPGEDVPGGRAKSGNEYPVTGFRRRGVTLLEMLVVVAIIGLMAGITFPSVSSGLDSIRLNSASDSIVSFFNQALSRADRRQEVVQITVSKAARTLRMRSTDPSFDKQLVLPDGITIASVLPEQPGDADAPRDFLLYPGGTPPAVGIAILNARGMKRTVRVDPITGVPRIEQGGN
jgi:prepilin-type N-terminal cleavage/methylation domain-containing protein